MLEEVEFEGEGGPHSGADGEEGFDLLAEGGLTELGMDLSFQLADPSADGGVGAEESADEEDGVGVAQFLGVVFGFLPEDGVGGILECQVAEEAGFEDAEDAGAEALEVLLKAPVFACLRSGRG